MKTVAVIPARLASSRFPRKPLAPLRGLPMIEHVYRRAKLSGALDGVFVAACDAELRAAVEGFGGDVIMTSPAHQRGTDRVAEAARRLGADIVVNIQGDEPLLVPEMVGLAVEPLRRDRSLACVNLMAPITSDEDFTDTNEIKVVVDRRNFALYMSRQPIPSSVHAAGEIPRFKQVCVIAFRAAALRRFSSLRPTPLERAESIDMMRFIENGIGVKMALSPYSTHSVDTPADLRFVERLLGKDPVAKRYLGGQRA